MQKELVQKKRKGFTLVELVVVVAIVAVLAVIAVPRFVSMTEGSKVATMEQNHGVLRTAITMYMADNNGTAPAAGLQTAQKYIADIDSSNTADIVAQSTTAASTATYYFKDKPKDAQYSWDGTTLTSSIPVKKGFDADDRAGSTGGTTPGPIAADGTYTVTFTP